MNTMKHLLTAIATVAIAAMVITSCNTDDDWDKYEDWRDYNVAWFDSHRDSLDANGNLYYTTLIPSWNPEAEVLIHYFNDRSLTEDNLSPLYTSTCNVIYYGRLIDDTPFDSSYVNTTYGKGIARFTPSGCIDGMAIALMDMRVGDSCEVAIPYPLAYGSSSTGTILPYSTLIFNIGLKDIPYYEVKP